MNPNVEQSLVVISSMMRDMREAFETLIEQLQGSNDHNAIAARNALEMNAQLARALAYYYTPTRQEYRDFDDHCFQTVAAGSAEPDPDLYWGELAFNHWKYRDDD